MQVRPTSWRSIEPILIFVFGQSTGNAKKASANAPPVDGGYGTC